jgi:hypothetical protein
LTKQDVAARIIYIKSLQEALDSELKQLRAHLDVGDDLSVNEGQVTLVSRTRRDFDEKRLLMAVLAEGLDPNLLGQVVLSVDRQKLSTSIDSGVVSQEFVDKNSSLFSYDALVVKPTSETKSEGFSKVSSLLSQAVK